MDEGDEVSIGSATEDFLESFFRSLGTIKPFSTACEDCEGSERRGFLTGGGPFLAGDKVATPATAADG